MSNVTRQESILRPASPAGAADPEVTVQMAAGGLVAAQPPSTVSVRTHLPGGPNVKPRPQSKAAASATMTPSEGLLHLQLGVDVRGVDIDGVAKPEFTALKDSEYRIPVAVRTNARSFRIRLSAAKAWALTSAQLWSSVRKIDAAVASSGDTAARGADLPVPTYVSPVVPPVSAVISPSTDIVAAPVSESAALRTEIPATPPQPSIVDAITLVSEYAEEAYTPPRWEGLRGEHQAYAAPYAYRRPSDLSGDLFAHPPIAFPASSLLRGSKYDPNTPSERGNTGYHPVAPWRGTARFSLPEKGLTHMRLHVSLVVAWPSEVSREDAYNLRMPYLIDIGAGSLYRHLVQMVADYDEKLGLPASKAFAARVPSLTVGEVYDLIYDMAAALKAKQQGSPTWVWQLTSTPYGVRIQSEQTVADIRRHRAASEMLVGYRPPVVRVAGYGQADDLQYLLRNAGNRTTSVRQVSDAVLPPRVPGRIGTFADAVIDLRGNVYVDSDPMPRLDARIVGNVGGRGFVAYLQPVQRGLALEGVAAHASPVASKSYIVVDGGEGSISPGTCVLGYGGNISTYTYELVVPAEDNMNVELTLQDAGTYGVVFGIDRAYAELVRDPLAPVPAPIGSSSSTGSGSSAGEDEPVAGSSDLSSDDSSFSSSLLSIASSLSSDAPAVSKLSLRAARRAWPDVWYTELLQGIPGDEWQSPVAPEYSSEGEDTGYTANVPVAITDSMDHYMGPFGNTYVRLSLAGVPAHTQLVVGLELFIKGPWRGSSEAAPHTIGVRRIGGVVRDELWQASIATVPGAAQSFPSRYSTTARVAAGTGADELGTLFYDTPSGIFVAEFDLDHDSDSVVLEIYGKNLPDDCTWGVARAYVKPAHVYAVNEAFDAAAFPQALVKYEDIPALVVGRAMLGSGFKSDLIFVNKAMPVQLYKDSLNEVRSLRFPVYGLADDVERFWQAAESVFESSPARAFDCRSARVGFAEEDKYPKYLNPMAVILGHVMAGNLLILKLAATGEVIPISVFNALRARLPVSCGLLLHTEIEVNTSHAMSETAVETFDVIDVESSTAWVGRPAARVWAGDATQNIPVYRANGALVDDGAYVALDTGEVISQADLAAPAVTPSTDVPGFPWWQHSGQPFIHVARWPDARSLTVALWSADRQDVSALILLKGADVAGVDVPPGGRVTVEAGVLRLTCASGTLTAPQEFVIRWSTRTVLMSEAAIITGYTG